MASNTITTNEPANWLIVHETPVHIALDGVFDGASIALEQDILRDGNESSVLDADDTAITYVNNKDDSLNFNTGDRIRLNPAGGGVSLSVKWNIAGASIDRS